MSIDGVRRWRRRGNDGDGWVSLRDGGYKVKLGNDTVNCMGL